MYNVLLVDNEPAILSALSHAIDWAAHDCHILNIARDGREAMLQFAQEAPDIVISDIRMPEVNGYEATEAIRQMSATVPIIALTAFAYEEDRQKIMHSGFTDFLTKPISSKVLLGKLESLKKI